MFKKLPQTFQSLTLFSELHMRLKPVESFQYYETLHDFLLNLGFDSV